MTQMPQQPQPYLYEPQPMPQPAPQQGDADRSRAFAITSFVLGIASIVSGWTLIAPIIGLVLGIIALKRQTTERTLALWGVWLNGIMLALAAILVLFIIGLLALGFFAIPFSA